MYCGNCGTQTDGKYCPNCGAELLTEKEGVTGKSVETNPENNNGNTINSLPNNNLPNTSAYAAAQQTKKKFTPLGIAAIILAFLGPLAFIGLVLGVVDIIKDKSKTFKHGLSIAAIVISCLTLLIFFSGLGGSDDTTDEITTVPEVMATETDTTNAVQTTTEKTIETTTELVVTGCDLEKAKRAAIVAITNGTAYDVFDSTGNSIDASKLHSYSDLSGNYIIVKDWGTWTAKDEKTWHAKGLTMELAETGLKIVGQLDVSFNGENYIVSNLDGEYGLGLKLSDLEEPYNNPEVYLTVSPKLVEEDRDNAKATGLPDNTGLLDEDIAMTEFEVYAGEACPYGIKLHWITGLIAHTQDKTTGEWFFKVNATITNGFGAEYKTVVEGRVSGTNDNPNVTYFYVYS